MLDFYIKLLTCFVTCIALTPSAAVLARTLFYGDASVELTEQKKTFPALHIRLSDQETVYGALYTAPAPQKSLHIQYDNTDYWVGQWCEPGTYLTINDTTCNDCGYGHYCTGGTERETCTGGAIACNTQTEQQNTTADAYLLNRFLTKEEVNEYMPITDMTQWEMISYARKNLCEDEMRLIPIEERRQHAECACANGTLEPGTYLFISSYKPSNTTQTPHMVIQMAVFSKPVGYISMHTYQIYETLIDVDHQDFEAYTIRTVDFNIDTDDANVTGAADVAYGLYIYKLK